MRLTEWAAQWNIPPAALADLQRRLMPSESTVVDPLTGEAEVQAAVRLAASKSGCRLWRNNVGVAVDENNSRVVRYGLCNDSAKMNKQIKSSDLIGIGPGGRFMAIEVKRPGWKYTATPREVAQKRFLDLVVSMGGIGKFSTGEI